MLPQAPNYRQTCTQVPPLQIISNRIVNFMARPHAIDDLPEWSISGVAVPLELLKLLAVLKDHSRPHKELYWRYLKASRRLILGRKAPNES